MNTMPMLRLGERREHQCWKVRKTATGHGMMQAPGWVREYRIFDIGRRCNKDLSKAAESLERTYYAAENQDSGEMYMWVGDMEDQTRSFP